MFLSRYVFNEDGEFWESDCEPTDSPNDNVNSGQSVPSDILLAKIHSNWQCISVLNQKQASLHLMPSAGQHWKAIHLYTAFCFDFDMAVKARIKNN